jgi:hypothetical protein
LNDLSIAALDYLGAGMHILALTGKRPNSKFHETWDWDNSIHGTPESPEDEEALESVFRDKTTTGIALLIPPHVLVADVDTEEAATLFTQLAGEPSEWETRTSKTPNGLHLWYLAPGADGSVWLGGRTLLFKGFGGYVAAPPSRHFDEQGNFDGVYTWLGDWAVLDWLPDGIAERLKVHEAWTTTSRKPEEQRIFTEFEFFPNKRFAVNRVNNLEGLCRAIETAPDGNQNNIIAWAAMQARDEGVPFESAMPQLLAAAIAGGHPEHRARTTIRGAYKRTRRG